MHPFKVHSHRKMSTIMTWLFGAGVTLRGNSGNRSGRRARRVSAGVSEDALATDSGVFEAWGRRWAEVHLTLCGAREPPSGKGRRLQCSRLCWQMTRRWWLSGRGGRSFSSTTQGRYGSFDKHLCLSGSLLTAVLKSCRQWTRPNSKSKRVAHTSRIGRMLSTTRIFSAALTANQTGWSLISAFDDEGQRRT